MGFRVLRMIFIPVVMCMVFVSMRVSANDTNEEAKALFQEGVSQFQEGNYAKAVVAFRKAKELRPAWKISYNIGQCEAALKNYGRALDAFEAYLAGGGDEIPDERRSYVVREIKRLSEMVGFLQIDAAQGAQIHVDGMDRGTIPLSGRIRVAVGVEHEVKATTSTGETIVKRVKVGFGEKLLVKMVAEETSTDEGAASGGNETASEGSAPASKKAWKKPFGLAAAIVGSTALLVGTITGSVALSYNNEVKEKCDDGLCEPDMHDTADKRKPLAVATDVLLPVGGVTGLVGVLFLTVFKDKDETQNLSLVPLSDRHTLGASLNWRF